MFDCESNIQMNKCRMLSYLLFFACDDGALFTTFFIILRITHAQCVCLVLTYLCGVWLAKFTGFNANSACPLE